MASLRKVYEHRYFVLIWCVAESLLLSAIIYGWASLVVVFKEERFFHHLCNTLEETNATSNGTSPPLDSSCVEQDERLNLVITVALFTFATCGIFVGTFYDYFGPRKTRWLSCSFFALSALFFGLSDKDRPNLLFPGMITLAVAGITMFLTVIQILVNVFINKQFSFQNVLNLLPITMVANMFTKWKSSVISLFNGALDSSAIVLLLFKLVYEGGVPINWIFISFFILAITFTFAFTFFLPPYTITTERLELLQKDMVLEKLRETGNKSSVKDDNPLLETESVNGIRKDCVENGKGKERLHSDLHEAPICGREVVELEEEEVVFGDSNAVKPPLLKIMRSPEYILLSLHHTVYTLRFWFYVGSLNSYLNYMSHNDIDTVNHYTNWFGIIQFAGFFFAPVVGLVMDWKPKSKKNKNSDIGFIIGFFLTDFISLVFNILVLIPDLRVQYVSFVLQVVLRAFAYATFGAFLLQRFPMVHYGKLFGIGHIFSGLVGCLQYPLFILNEGALNKDPFWINIGLSLLCLLLFSLPIYLWLKESKEERNSSTVSNNQIQA